MKTKKFASKARAKLVARPNKDFAKEIERLKALKEKCERQMQAHIDQITKHLAWKQKIEQRMKLARAGGRDIDGTVKQTKAA